MPDANGSAATAAEVAPTEREEVGHRAVATHVLISEDQVLRLRELSRRTRIAQSEYLREAVDDLLAKYGCLPRERK